MRRPSWQRAPCPAWCTVEHGEHDHPEDRAHRDSGIVIPVVFRRRGTDEDDPLRERVEPGRLVLGRWQRDGEEHSWRLLGDDEGLEIEISEESFSRLAAAIAASRDDDVARRSDGA